MNVLAGNASEQTRRDVIADIAEDVIHQVLIGEMQGIHGRYFQSNEEDGGCKVCAIGAAIVRETEAFNLERRAIGDGEYRNYREANRRRDYDLNSTLKPEELTELEQLFEKVIYGRHKSNEPYGEKVQKYATENLLTIYALVLSEKGDVDAVSKKIRAGRYTSDEVMRAVKSVADAHGLGIKDGTKMCEVLSNLRFLVERTVS